MEDILCLPNKLNSWHSFQKTLSFFSCSYICVYSNSRFSMRMYTRLAVARNQPKMRIHVIRYCDFLARTLMFMVR